MQAKKLYPEDCCPNIIFSQSQPYTQWTPYTPYILPPAGLPDYQGKRGHGHYPDPGHLLGHETSSLFKEAFFTSSPRKKSKLSERLVEKLR